MTPLHFIPHFGRLYFISLTGLVFLVGAIGYTDRPPQRNDSDLIAPAVGHRLDAKGTAPPLRPAVYIGDLDKILDEPVASPSEWHTTVLVGSEGAEAASAALSRDDPTSLILADSSGSTEWLRDGACGCLKVFHGEREWLCFVFPDYGLEPGTWLSAHITAGWAQLRPDSPPDLVIRTWTGGNHGDWSYWIFAQEETPRLIYCSTDWNLADSGVEMKDLDGDGTPELIQCSNEWMGVADLCMAASPHPRAVFAWDSETGSYVPAAGRFPEVGQESIEQYHGVKRQQAATPADDPNWDEQIVTSALYQALLEYSLGASPEEVRAWAIRELGEERGDELVDEILTGYMRDPYWCAAHGLPTPAADPPDTEPPEDSKFSFGKVVSTSDNTISIREYDFSIPLTGIGRGVLS